MVVDAEATGDAGCDWGIIFSRFPFAFTDGFGRLLQARRERGTANLLMDWYLELQDYVIGYVQMSVEMLRSLRSFSLEDCVPYDLNAATASSSSSLQSNGPRGRRRNMAAQASRMTTSRMPELEETDINKLQADQATSTPQSLSIRPLEPSFLKDEDYPPGWLVFDPVLGVVSKVEADKFKQEYEQKRAMELKQSPQRQKQSSSPRRQTPQSVQRKQQASPPHFKSNSNIKSTPSRPLRSANVMPNASTMHTPQTIAANG